MLIENHLLLNVLQEGTTSISNLLLDNYKKLGLVDQEMMLIIHITYYQRKGNLFPSVSELQNKMNITTEELMRLLQRLVRDNYIQIDDKRDSYTGMLSEAYNLNPLYKKLIKVIERDIQIETNQKLEKKEEDNSKNLFLHFEEEFGRPLSPMEIETINTWIDQDRNSLEIILFALKEAVFSNKLNFRYIDRILFEWDKKQLKTIEQIREHIKEFRNSQKKGSSKQTQSNTSTDKRKLDDFEFYNWLDDIDS